MKYMNLALLAALSFGMLTGCAQIDTTLSKMDYETGTFVSQEQMSALSARKASKQDVINTIGHPPQKAEVSGKEVWTYTYTRLPMIPFKKNTFENTVFEFKGSKLVGAYKTGGTPGKSGNALLDAAGM